MNINRTIWGFIYFGVISLVAYKLMMWATPFGSGVSPDSTTYINAAKSLISGRGFSINGSPVTHYPPLYPFFLAGAGWVENDLIRASRFLNAIIFGINVGLVGLAVFLCTKQDFLTSSFAVIFFLSSAPLLEVHAWAWSEPLFTVLSVLCVILLSLYAVRPTTSLHIASSLSLGLALVTRYIGIAFLPAALVIVFIGGSEQPIGRRFRNVFSWLFVALIPLVGLLVRNLSLAGSATNRNFIFHPMPVYQYFDRIASTTTRFFAPGSLPAGMKLVIFGLILVLLMTPLWILLKHHRAGTDWRRLDLFMTASSLLFFLSYIFFLWFSISLVDAATPVDMRLLSPILVLLIVGSFSALWGISQMLKQPIVSWGLLLILALSILVKTPEAFQKAKDIQKKGLGYTALRWQRSEGLAFIRTLGNGVTLYSNGIDVIDLLTDKQALSFPSKMESTTLVANIHYEKEIETMCKDVAENGALLVYFPEFYWRRNLPSQTEIETICQLSNPNQLKDATVYSAK